MINREIHWKIKGKDANVALPGMDVKIPIYSANYNEIFEDRDIIASLDYVHEIFYDVFKSDDKELMNSLMSEIHLSYIPDNGEYHIGFDYQEMFENILSKLAVEDLFIENMKLPKEMQSIKDNYNFFMILQDTIYQDKKLRLNYPVELPDTIMTDDILDKMLNKLGILLRGLHCSERLINTATRLQLEEEKEFEEGKRDTAIRYHDYISWKNLMYYTSIKALHIFDETKDPRYYRYAKNYYNNVSRSRNASYPCGMDVDGKFYHYDFSKFNSEFLSVRKRNFSELLVRLNIEDKNVVKVRPNLKRGSNLRAIIVKPSISSKKTDYTKINPSLGRKISFYKGLSSKTKGIIPGLGKDQDYIGYVFDNDYVVFDKFYEVDENGASPAKDAAIYVASLDILDRCDYDRKKLRQYIDKHNDSKAFRFIHTENDSYQAKIKEVMNLRNRSRLKYKRLELRNENK